MTGLYIICTSLGLHILTTRKNNRSYRLDKIKNDETKTNDVGTMFYIKQWYLKQVKIDARVLASSLWKTKQPGQETNIVFRLDL